MNKDVIKRMIVVGLFLHVCVVTDASSADDFDIKEATAWFVGSYTSEQHSKRDTMFSNESIEVRRIWESREDGHWFSLERFSASNLDTPLQQFVVQLRGVEENMLQMRFYVFRSSDHPKVLWTMPEATESFDVEDLRLARGCEIYLQRNAESFFGGTHGMACHVGGPDQVSYMSRKISFGLTVMTFWEQGYSSTNTLVYGNEKGPYYFLKQKP